MRITIKNGTTEQTLAHGAVRTVSDLVNPYHAGPDGLSISGPVEYQLRQFVRAESAAASNRDNARSELAFSVHAEFASVQDAEYYAVLHAADILRAGDVYLYVESAGGLRRTVRIPDAVLHEPVIATRGCTVSIQYALAGGKAERVES